MVRALSSVSDRAVQQRPRVGDVQTQTHDVTLGTTEVRKRYVRWDAGEAEREWACLTLLAEHSPGTAPLPLRREVADGGPIVVMERLPGRPLGGAPLTGDQTASLGRALRRMYDVPVEAVREAGLAERRYGPTSHVPLLLDWLADPYDLTPSRDAVLVAEAVQAARTWLARPGALPEPRLSTLGIADLNPANIIWDGETCRLVDFEDGGLTEPAYELADHVEHLAGRLSGVIDADALVAAVGLTASERERFHGYRPLWACFWLAMLLPGNGGFHRNPPGTTEAQARRVLGLLA